MLVLLVPLIESILRALLLILRWSSSVVIVLVMSVSKRILTIEVMLLSDDHCGVLFGSLRGFLISITDFTLRSLDLYSEDVDDSLGRRGMAVLLGFLRSFLILVVPVGIELFLDPANDTTILFL